MFIAVDFLIDDLYKRSMDGDENAKFALKIDEELIITKTAKSISTSGIKHLYFNVLIILI